jgi:chromosome segregation ATPase
MERSDDTLADLSAALERLKTGMPLIVTGKYSINQSTVCREAGRHRSIIKKNARFAKLREDIRAASSARGVGKVERTDQHQLLARQLEKLREEKDGLERSLDDAGEMILRLYLQLQTLEDERRYILERVAHARKTSKAVERVFTLISFDELTAGHDPDFEPRG